ncbi:competence protein ComEA [Nakamurella panacisegetis]|uniref:Competence protein ComEA n=1 Tax=Nakamurella panacisegetis TaxID=1090615 RepID=A0A1H0HUE4_9ACTN|nr:ComEA family DNA-binding protein [Nakamurella panacisegetis]SDO22690.1 competence protein ComEA [Nakamurella panacisegetis]
MPEDDEDDFAGVWDSDRSRPGEPIDDDTARGPAEGRPARTRRGASGPGSRRWGRLAQRWVPDSLRDSRIDPGKRGALLLTLVAAVAASVAAIGVWRDRPEPRPVQAVSLAQASAVATDRTPGTTGARSTASRGHPATGTARADATQSATVVVSVTGAVRRPGLVRLPSGARVADAIAKAGGTTSSATLTGLNLAAKLTDGASVVVADRADPSSGASSGSFVSGSDGGGGGSGTAGAPAGKLDLNTADAAALDALPGVGPVTAAAIVAWREKNGRFASVEQLQEIQGIGPAKFAALAKLVTV